MNVGRVSECEGVLVLRTRREGSGRGRREDRTTGERVRLRGTAAFEKLAKLKPRGTWLLRTSVARVGRGGGGRETGEWLGGRSGG